MLRGLDRLVEFLVGALAVALIATAFGQVVARYLFSYSFSWVLEVDVMLLVWLTFLSIGLGVVGFGFTVLAFVAPTLIHL